MAITIDRDQRDAIYSQIRNDLSGVDDISRLLDSGDIEAALRHRRWFEDDMRLLDDLGWEPEPAGQRFELTMPAVDLARLFGRLNGEAGAELEDAAALLDDLGWAPQDARESFELVLPRKQLRRIAKRLRLSPDAGQSLRWVTKRALSLRTRQRLPTSLYGVHDLYILRWHLTAALTNGRVLLSGHAWPVAYGGALDW
jgi:hypothetical protein